VSVVSHTNAAGDVSVGVVIEGAFVPFATLSAAKVAQYVERGHDLQARAEGKDVAAAAMAQEVLGTAFKPKAKNAKSKDED